jgi:hypothetical protein
MLWFEGLNNPPELEDSSPVSYLYLFTNTIATIKKRWVKGGLPWPETPSSSASDYDGGREGNNRRVEGQDSADVLAEKMNQEGCGDKRGDAKKMNMGGDRKEADYDDEEDEERPLGLLVGHRAKRNIVLSDDTESSSDVIHSPVSVVFYFSFMLVTASGWPNYAFTLVLHTLISRKF